MNIQLQQFHGMARRGEAGHGMARRGMAGHTRERGRSTAQHFRGKTARGSARRGMARHGGARRGKAGQGEHKGGTGNGAALSVFTRESNKIP
jgi:hypothetical protein